MEYVIPALVVAFVVYLIYQTVSKGGFTGALLDSKISNTVGEIEQKKALVTEKVKVHQLENGRVGVEFASRAALGFSVNAFSLSPEDTARLIEFLERARSA